MASDSRPRAGHAIVLGGSMAGLMAARVLAQHVERVTLIERDELPTAAAHRRGVPQGRHTHALIAGGCQAIEQLFPGISQTLLDAGGVPADDGQDMRWFFEGGFLARTPTGRRGVMVTRPLLEATVRARVRALPRVIIRDGCHVAGLCADSERRYITGVRLLTGEMVAADLVVDASGRGSRMPQWLSALGYPAPEEEQVEVGISYTTRFFRRDPRQLSGDLGVIVPPTPSGKQGGVLLAQEGLRWTVTLLSHFRPGAGESLPAFLEFAAQLPSTAIYNVIRTAEPLGEAFLSRFPASLRRRYERVPRFPEQLVVLGDAICSFNPIYGQGMSVAAQEALSLDAVLSSGRHRVGMRFFRRAAPIIDNPWTTAVGNDLRMPEVNGPRSAVGTAINGYIARLQRGAHRSPALTRAFLQVSNLTAHPSSLFAPAVVARVIAGSMTRRTAAASGPAIAVDQLPGPI